MLRVLYLLLLIAFTSQVHAQTPPTIEFYGDSITYRSAWNCEGQNLTPAQCTQLKHDASYPNWIKDPYANGSNLWNVLNVDGVSGSTCTPRPTESDPGLLARLTNHNAQYVAILHGINDVNLQVKTIPQTVSCLVSAWTVIAEQWHVKPIAVLYPPIQTTNTVWAFAGTDGPTSASNLTALNSAILTAANTFNVNHPTSQQIKVIQLYSGSYFDGVHPNPDGALMMAKHWFWAFN